MPIINSVYKHCGVRQWSALGHPIRGNVHNRLLSESQQRQFKSMEQSSQWLKRNQADSYATLLCQLRNLRACRAILRRISDIWMSRISDAGLLDSPRSARSSTIPVYIHTAKKTFPGFWILNQRRQIHPMSVVILS